MRLVISPAKKLHPAAMLPNSAFSQPLFLEQSQVLIDILREKDSFSIAALMKLSMKLADLNVERYQQWHTPFSPNNAKQAIFSFAGDVYQGLDASSLSPEDIAFAQQHLRMLSGLYGLLRPLDLMQAYRLEMGTKLTTPQGNNLYDFWGNSITQQILDELQAEPDRDSTLINLASQEYFKAVQAKNMPCRIITPVFKDYKNGTYKIIGIFAKRARGLMARYIIQQRLDQAEGMLDFAVDGYAFNPSLSEENNWVFSRG